MSNEAISSLVKRVERLERMVEALVERVPVPNAVRESVSAAPSAEVSPPAQPLDQKLERKGAGQKPARPEPKREPLGSSQFLGTVGVICFVLAGSYFIKLAITEGWITPMMQLGAVAAFGLTLVMAGFLLREKDRPYASLLPAGGVVLLYMAACGGHIVFGVYDFSTAKILVNAVAICSIALYLTFRHHFYALAACVGVYMVPFLLGFGALSLSPLCFYMTVWNVAFSIIGILVGSRTLLALTAYIAVLAFGFLGEAVILRDPASLQSVAVFQAFQFALFCVVITWYSLFRREALSRAEAWALFPLLLLFYLDEHGLLARLSPELAPWYELAFAAWVYGLFQLAKLAFGERALDSWAMVSCFVAVAAVHAGCYGLLPPQLWPCVGVVVTLALAFWLRSGKGESGYAAAMLVLSYVVVIEYLNVLFGARQEYSPPAQVVLNLLYAVTLMLLSREARESGSSLAPVVWLLGGVQLLVGLNNLSAWVLAPDSAALGTSAMWSATALVLLLIAKGRDGRALASNSMWLFGLVAGKVLLLDLAESGTGVKIAALLVIGVLFYAGGYAYRGIGDRRTA